MPRVCEYLYHKGANTLCFYRLAIAGGLVGGGGGMKETKGFPCEHMYTQVHPELSTANLHFLGFFLIFSLQCV